MSNVEKHWRERHLGPSSGLVMLVTRIATDTHPGRVKSVLQLHDKWLQPSQKHLTKCKQNAIICNPCSYPEPLSPWPCKAFFISTVRRVPWAKWQPGSLLTAKHAKDDRKWLVSFSLNIFQEILKQRLTWRKHQNSSFTPTQSESSKGSMKCPGNRHTIRMLGWTIFGPFEGRVLVAAIAVSRVGCHGCKNA